MSFGQLRRLKKQNVGLWDLALSKTQAEPVENQLSCHKAHPNTSHSHSERDTCRGQGLRSAPQAEWTHRPGLARGSAPSKNCKRTWAKEQRGSVEQDGDAMVEQLASPPLDEQVACLLGKISL